MSTEQEEHPQVGPLKCGRMFYGTGIGGCEGLLVQDEPCTVCRQPMKASR